MNLKISYVGDTYWCPSQGYPNIRGEFLNLFVRRGNTLETVWEFIDDNQSPISLEHFYLTVMDFEGNEGDQQLITYDHSGYRFADGYTIVRREKQPDVPEVT